MTKNSIFIEQDAIKSSYSAEKIREISKVLIQDFEKCIKAAEDRFKEIKTSKENNKEFEIEQINQYLNLMKNNKIYFERELDTIIKQKEEGN